MFSCSLIYASLVCTFSLGDQSSRVHTISRMEQALTLLACIVEMSPFQRGQVLPLFGTELTFCHGGFYSREEKGLVHHFQPMSIHLGGATDLNHIVIFSKVFLHFVKHFISFLDASLIIEDHLHPELV